MAVNSTMLALGTPAPAFTLAEPLTGSEVSSADFSQPALLVMFICNHCPYVQHVRSGLVQLRADYSTADLGMVAISANDPGSHPGDAPSGSPRRPGPRATASRTCSTRRRRPPRPTPPPALPTSSSSAPTAAWPTAAASTAAAPAATSR